jgi:glycosyltransferase involved in cell wall biosynthesis
MGSDALTLVVPVYNEAEAVAELLGRLTALREACPAPVEILLVDDGSDDGTGERLREQLPEGMRVLRHERNLGYGAALKTGVHAASHDWVAITDADGTYPEGEIPRFFEQARADDLDMVVGARTGAEVHIPWTRRPAKRVLRELACWLSGRSIPDLNSGLRVMRRAPVERFLHLLPDGFSFTTTITLAMLSTGCRVAYEPIDYRRRTGRSKIRPFADTLNFLQLIFRTVLWFNPLRVFLPLSGALFLLAWVVLFGSMALQMKPMDVTFGVLLMASVQILALGLVADLLDKRMP